MRRIIVMFLLCIAGALLNIVFNRVIIGTALPLYLDTVLTISVTLLGGLTWGILCGALTNLTGHSIWFWGWEGYLFTLCNIATAVITFLFARFFPRELAIGIPPFSAERKSRLLSVVMDRIVVLILLSFALCIAMSILGGILAAFIQIFNPSMSGNHGFSKPLGTTLFTQRLPVAIEEIMSRIPVNIIDRLVSAFAGYGIAFLLQNTLLRQTQKFPGKLKG